MPDGKFSYRASAAGSRRRAVTNPSGASGRSASACPGTTPRKARSRAWSRWSSDRDLSGNCRMSGMVLGGVVPIKRRKEMTQRDYVFDKPTKMAGSWRGCLSAQRVRLERASRWPISRALFSRNSTDRNSSVEQRVLNLILPVDSRELSDLGKRPAVQCRTRST